MVIATGLANGLVAHLFLPLVWLILSRWLEGRNLIVASVAASTAWGVGRSSYSGPPTPEAWVALVAVVSTVAAGVLIACFWLARHARQNEQVNG